MKPFKIWGNLAIKKVCLFLLQKITVNFKKFYSTEEQFNELCEELKSVFMADGKIDILEENLFRALKHQLSQR